MSEADDVNKNNNLYYRPKLSVDSERSIFLAVSTHSKGYEGGEGSLVEFLNDYDETNPVPETHPYKRLNEQQVVTALTKTSRPSLKSKIIKSAVEISARENPMLAIYVLLHGNAAGVARRIGEDDPQLIDLVENFTADAYYRASDSSRPDFNPVLALEIATAAKHYPDLDRNPIRREIGFNKTNYHWEWVQRQRDMLDFLVVQCLRKADVASDFSAEEQMVEQEMTYAFNYLSSELGVFTEKKSIVFGQRIYTLARELSNTLLQQYLKTNQISKALYVIMTAKSLAPELAEYEAELKSDMDNGAD